MCGIAGLVNTKGSVSTIEIALTKTMTDLIRHRGPDDEGFYFRNNLALGHRRLSILDLSECGHQPMKFNNSYVLIFNGEIYNYLEIKEELTRDGYAFNSSTDTEVILASYHKWGESCLGKFNGMWAFALYDIEKNLLFCARDRFGVKPFYFTTINGYFAFASEIKAFSAFPEWNREINLSRVFDFLLAGIFDHTNETLFKDVFQLPAGHVLRYNLTNHDCHVSKWYDLKSMIQPFHGGYEQAKSDFKNLLSDSIRLRLRSDVKVGSCLSGGLDSSSLVCLINEQLAKEGKTHIQETVSSCFQDKRFDEQNYIDDVVAKTKVINHKTFPDLSELFGTLDKIIWHQDGPVTSSSIYAQWNVFKEAKKNNLIVMLDGQGADESLGGYHLFFPPLLNGHLKKGSLKKLLREIKAIKNKHEYSYLELIKRLGIINTPRALKNIFKKHYGHPYLKYKKYKQYIKSEEINTFKETSIDQISSSNLPMLLHYEDRDSMAHSIESRVPFLDYRLVEFILGLAEEFKIENGTTKRILRDALKNSLPETVTNRFDKMAFVTPESDWFKSNKDQIAKELSISLDLMSGLLDKNRVLEDFEKDYKNLKMGSFYWRLMCLGRWIKVFNLKGMN